MIKDKNAVLAQVNSPTEVTSEAALVINKFVVASNSTRKLEAYNPGAKRIMFVGPSNYVDSFYYGQPNKLVCVDNGTLSLQNDPSTDAPPDRQLVQEWLGNNTNERTITLEPGWYEVEVIGGGGGGGGGARAMVYHAIKPSTGGDGGAGGRCNHIFLLNTPTQAKIVAGGGGLGGGGRRYSNVGGTLHTMEDYTGGEGGKYSGPFLFLTPPNNGINANWDAIAGTYLGGVGEDGGARGGNIIAPEDYFIIGGTGGGAVGPWGGNGGDIQVPANSTYRSAYSALGGAGGAGGGLGLAGKGGSSVSTSGPVPAAAAGSGASGGNAAALGVGSIINGRPGAGGGGGGASRFICGDIDIVAGGGGGGAGGSFDITDDNNTQHAGNGAPGENNMNNDKGGGDIDGGKGGQGAAGYVVVDGPTGTIMISPGNPLHLKGSVGYIGAVRLWKRVFAPAPTPPSGGSGGSGGGGSNPPAIVEA